MASESINFSEELIPEIVAIIRAGIAKSETYRGVLSKEKRAKVKRSVDALEEQCVDLMEYWDRLKDGG